MKIQKLIGREIIDSRGQPALEVEAVTDSFIQARAGVPSGASKGKFEACELRDEDPSRFHGKGLLKACANIKQLSRELSGFPLTSVEALDQKLIELDGTPLKTHIGANAILGVSIACAKILAQAEKKPFYSFFNPEAKTLPCPLVNVLNGGVHANNRLDVQEFMLVPHGFSSFKEALRAVCEIFQNLRQDLKAQGQSVALGDEGGVAPLMSSNEEALKLLLRAIEKSQYQAGKQVSLALDIAASSFYKKEGYFWEGRFLTAQDLISIYDQWIQKYPIVSIEDGLDEEDWEGWRQWTALHGQKIQIVGDDLFVTHWERLKKGIEQQAGNALLVKVNQVGTVSLASKAVQTAHQAGWSCVMSHRSGETEDDFIADLALAFNCQQIKTGGVSRGERTAKYNRLLRIEEELGKKAVFASF